jgi:intracellular multiplication protein IcmL
LDQPNLSTASLLQWANTAAVAAFTFNFVNYRQELQAASEFFTPEGWNAYLQSLQDSDNLVAVIQKKLVVSAVATGAPIINQSSVVSGRYTWQVQMPLLVTYQSLSQITQQSLMVNMVITRISTLDSPRGIGIAQFIATQSGTTNQV